MENLFLEDSSNCPDWRIMLFARGKRLSHTQPAIDSKIQPYTLPTILPYILSKDAQTLGKTQPDPQSHLDTLKGRHAQTLLYNYIHTCRRPHPDPHTWKEQTVKQDTHGHTQRRYIQVI